ncbi:MAG: 23S rRNA (pseudouridine(1915)-N(3))-methyltransferase RlmH [Candidatus Izemoplasmatales bacterium]|uniref:Ribosomal RNA large subunit methyltransferase H n=1 Tax=Hujiaoplasma nucleasis TaxID=2725268 RepID=A0A7L6N858_9MOLU|nr:23S rRNA (pseudouridine(1915)-N(3))-methyltransferase RlmH [Hujiaoplasma nucleasis]QLY40719.1 23S rRNA (pseudouridine(1915)-N(3))-methyltransferase RlmH [Hujiaoplasma nucleasis]
MKIKIISVGKIKEKYFKNAIDEYSKRISKYSKLEFLEVPDEKAPESLSDKDMEIIKDKEGEKILSKINNEYIIVLDIFGNQLDSIDLSKKIIDIFSYQSSDIVFIIGGSLGLSKQVIDKANLKLSFSKLTFPHQLMKVLLLEQIYRSFRIINNEPYHK